MPPGPNPYQNYPRSDNVPTSGPWQTDPELRRLMQAYLSAQARNAQNWRRGGTDAEAQALNRYIAQNRQRLGIPDNYTVDPRTGGLYLYDPNQNTLRDTAITGGAMAVGGYGLGQALQGLTAINAAPAATDGLLPSSAIPNLHNAVPGAISPLTNAVTATPPLATPPPSGRPPTPPVTDPRSLTDRLRNMVTNPENIASLASLIPLLMAANSGPSQSEQDQMAQANKLSQITETRMRRVDPLHQAVTQLAFGRLPVSSRNGIALQNIDLPK
jgi:hypothetical protein